MKLNIKNIFINGYKLTLLASIISISVLGSGCQDKEVATQEVDKAPAEAIIQADQQLEKSVEAVVLATNAEPTVMDNELAQQVSMKTGGTNKATAKPVKNGLIEMLITDIKVIDGSSFEGKDSSGKKVTVKMTGVQAPKINEEMGADSAEALGRCISEKRAIIFVQANNQKDKDGRYLAKVESAEIECNQQQIEKGMAWFYEDQGDKLSDNDHHLYYQAHEYALENNGPILMMEFKNRMAEHTQ